MSKFVSGNELSTEIRSILQERNSRCAVAFWGHGSETWLTGPNARVIANLRMGGTNPRALQKVSAEKRQCDVLHAKVYIGASKAVVSSANASINGLALEGSEQSGWIEAGTVVEQIGEITRWFDDLWETSRPITTADWQAAEELWLMRSRTKPALPSFAAFDPTADRLPLVVWSDLENYTTNEEAVEAAVGIRGPEARKRVDEGLWVTNEQDARSLFNRWVLIWTKNADGTPSRRNPPWFTRMSEIVVEGGFSWDADGQPQDVVLAAEGSPPGPFDTSEPRFVKAFSKIISQAKYAPLLEDDECEPWYEPRETLMRSFWAAAHAEYAQLSPT